MIEVGVDRAPAVMGGLVLLVMTALLPSCAEVEVGAEALKSLSRSTTPASADAEAPNADSRFASAPGSPINPGLEPDPDEFETTGFAVWDGARTLQGIWVAHPKAREARRVRVINSETGRAVDGALFRRDTRIGGPPILISSEAAAALGLEPDATTKLVIVALKPSTRPSTQVAATEPNATTDQSGAIEESSLAEATPDEGLETDHLVAAAGTAAATDAMVEEVASETSEEIDEETTTLAEIDAETPDAESNEELLDVNSNDQSVAVVEAETVTSEPPPVDAALPAAIPIAATAETDSVANEEEAPEPEAANIEPELKWEEPPVETVANPPPKNPAPAPATTSDQTPLPSGNLVIKAGVFGVKENADSLIQKIRNAGFPATGETFTSGSRTLTSVVAGPFDSPEQQAAALHVIRGLGVPDAIATKG